MFLFRRKRPLKDLSDQELVQSYKESADMLVLGELYERYTQLGFLTCMKYLRDEDEARDAVMHVYEKMIQDLKKYEVKQFRFWFHTILKNHCLSILEKKKRVSTQPDLFWEKESDGVEFSPFATLDEDSVETHEDQLQNLEKAIGELGEEQQICIRLFYLEDKSYKEIVESTGFDTNQVKSFIQNGKRNLKIMLERMQQHEK